MFGIGLGAFVDGIVLHQVLQWHHMLSARPTTQPDTVAGLQANVVADGLFHLGALIAATAGLFILLREWRLGRLAPPWGTHIGMALAGWGTFNVIEGLVNHHLLGVHHVRDDIASPQAWDLGFLVISAVLLAGGLRVAARPRARHPSHHDNIECPKDG